MRLNPANVQPKVTLADNTVRPIRIRIAGGLCLAMDADEAITLARQLVAAVDELRGRSRVVLSGDALRTIAGSARSDHDTVNTEESGDDTN